MALLIGIDAGTTNRKAAAFTADGKLFCEYKTPTVTRTLDDGCACYDTGELWESICGLLRRTAADCGREGQQILGVSVTSMAESVVPIGRDGKALFPMIAWFDTCASAQAARIEKKIGRERIFALCGLDPDPIFSLPKMLWVRDRHPEVYENAVKWLQMADYLYYRLCGAFATDYTLACRTLAFDLSARRWSREILDAFDVPADVFPEVFPGGALLGRISAAAAEETGLPAGTPVYAGGHDHPCATVTSGALKPGRIMDSSGTAEALLLISPPGAPVPTRPEGQRVGLYLDPDRYVLWGGIKSSGAAADWGYALTGRDPKTMGPGDYDKILRRAEQVAPGCDGLVFLPHLRGSGAPDWNVADRGACIGLGAGHTDAHLMRAVFEGLSCQARIIAEMHQRISGVRAEALCVAGGSVKNRLWQQIKADILQMPVECCPFDDATVQGAALLAAVGAGVYSDIAEASAASALRNITLYPDPTRAEIYGRIYERYLTVNEAVCRLQRSLSAAPGGTT